MTSSPGTASLCGTFRDRYTSASVPKISASMYQATNEVEEVDYPDGHYPRVGEDVWYVHDGHHRVMLAIQQGRR